MKFQVLLLLRMRVKAFLENVCPTLSYYFEEDVNAVADSPSINKEYRSIDFNTITHNEALVIDIDLCNNQNLILATIYCPNGNPNSRLFETINNLSDNVMFVGDFNSKLEAFGCAKKNSSGPVLKNIQNHLNLTYLNSDEHTHLDRAKGSTDILDMAFISPNLTKHESNF